MSTQASMSLRMRQTRRRRTSLHEVKARGRRRSSLLASSAIFKPAPPALVKPGPPTLVCEMTRDCSEDLSSPKFEAAAAVTEEPQRKLAATKRMPPTPSGSSASRRSNRGGTSSVVSSSSATSSKRQFFMSKDYRQGQCCYTEEGEARHPVTELRRLRVSLRSREIDLAKSVHRRVFYGPGQDETSQRTSQLRDRMRVRDQYERQYLHARHASTSCQ